MPDLNFNYLSWRKAASWGSLRVIQPDKLLEEITYNYGVIHKICVQDYHVVSLWAYNQLSYFVRFIYPYLSGLPRWHMANSMILSARVYTLDGRNKFGL